MLKNKKIVNFAKICLLLVFIAIVGITLNGFLFNGFTPSEKNKPIIPTIKKKFFDVDLVYLWCDGEDPQFKEKKNYWLKQENKDADRQATATGRFEQIDELKYSLRSVEKYIPWVRHIYIVTYEQVPSWLNTKHPKITVVDHSQILPKEYLPVFNSNAIETGIYKIPGLSEHFLYANDDTFINRPLKRSFFFKKGKPIVRVRPQPPLNLISQYHRQILNVIELAEKDFDSLIPRLSDRQFTPHHNIDAYLKSDYKACVEHFEKEYNETLTHRFRKDTSVQRLLVSMWSVMKKHSIVKVVRASKKKPRKIDSLYIVNRKKNYAKKIERLNPGLFCINDSEFSTQKDRMRLKEYLGQRFPEKSQFEL